MEKYKEKYKNTFLKIGKLINKKTILVLVVVIGGAYWYISKNNTTTVTNYETEKVTKGTVENIVSETGEILTTNQVTVTSSIAGFVTDVYIKNGDTVKNNQQLFKVNSTATEQERTKAYADYLSAKNNLESAQNKLNTLEPELIQKETSFETVKETTSYKNDEERDAFKIAESAYTYAKNSYDSQKDTIAQAQVSLSKAWMDYQATIDGVVKANAAGIIANLAIAPGQYINTTDTATIIKNGTTDTWVKVSLNETDIIRVKPEQTTKVVVEALNNKELKGKVSRVDEIGTVDSGVVTYNVYILVENAGAEVKPGMTVQIDIATESKEDVVMVPNSAIKPYRGGRAVQVLDSETNQPKYLPIEIGLEGPDYTEVLKGIEVGQEVIISQTQSTNKNGTSVSAASSSNKQPSFSLLPSGRRD